MDKKKRVFRDRQYRLPIKLLVNFGHDLFNGTYFIENLSSGGLFVASEKPLKVGSTFKIQFVLPHNRQEYTVEARVSWVRDKAEDNQLPGMGVSFEGLNPEEESILKQAIDQYKGFLDG